MNPPEPFPVPVTLVGSTVVTELSGEVVLLVSLEKLVVLVCKVDLVLDNDVEDVVLTGLEVVLVTGGSGVVFSIELPLTDRAVVKVLFEFVVEVEEVVLVPNVPELFLDEEVTFSVAGSVFDKVVAVVVTVVTTLLLLFGCRVDSAGVRLVLLEVLYMVVDDIVVDWSPAGVVTGSVVVVVVGV